MASAAAAASAGASASSGAAAPPGETVEEYSLQDIATGYAEDRLSAQRLTQTYLTRIDQLDKQGPALGAVIEVNPRALEIAAALDSERKSRGPRGPLHGVPVLIKDN